MSHMVPVFLVLVCHLLRYLRSYLDVFYIVAAKSNIISTSSDFYDAIVWIVAILTGLNTLFQPLEKGRRFRRAWTLLSVSLARYRADTDYKLDQVLSAYEQGEAIMHETPSQRAPAQQPPQ
jgi:hypothetical protein